MPGFTQIPNDEAFDDGLWTADTFTKGQALVDLYSLAQFQGGKVMKRGIIIDLKPGQLGWSMDSLGKRWKWSIGKVRRFLKYLETTGHIAQQKTNVSTTITLLHWIHNDIPESRKNGIQKERKQYSNNIVNNVNIEKRESKHTEIDLSDFKNKYPDIDVDLSYKKFMLNTKEKGKKFDDIKSAFDRWLMNDIEWGTNVRDKTNDLVTVYCTECDDNRKVKPGKDVRHAVCETCEIAMVENYQYKQEKALKG